MVVLKEKLLAAHRGAIKTVIIPHENEKDLVDISDEVKGELDIRPVRWIDEVLEIALTEIPMASGKRKLGKKSPSRRVDEKACGNTLTYWQQTVINQRVWGYQLNN